MATLNVLWAFRAPSICNAGPRGFVLQPCGSLDRFGQQILISVFFHGYRQFFSWIQTRSQRQRKKK